MTERQLSAKNVKQSDSELKFYTGISNAKLFYYCFELITKGQLTLHNQSALCLEDQVLLVLIRLRLGLSEQLLAYLFNINITTVSRIFLRWIPTMYRKFKMLNIWPTKDQVMKTLPMAVALKYPSLRVIIDCTEIKIPKPTSQVNQQITSSNKNCKTAKALVGFYQQEQSHLFQIFMVATSQTRKSLGGQGCWI